jgi:hypothetical protein
LRSTVLPRMSTPCTLTTAFAGSIEELQRQEAVTRQLSKYVFCNRESHPQGGPRAFSDADAVGCPEGSR